MVAHAHGLDDRGGGEGFQECCCGINNFSVVIVVFMVVAVTVRAAEMVAEEFRGLFHTSLVRVSVSRAGGWARFALELAGRVDEWGCCVCGSPVLLLSFGGLSNHDGVGDGGDGA